eukprot:6455593-Amphidinium_carterae.5
MEAMHEPITIEILRGDTVTDHLPVCVCHLRFSVRSNFHATGELESAAGLPTNWKPALGVPDMIISATMSGAGGRSGLFYVCIPICGSLSTLGLGDLGVKCPRIKNQLRQYPYRDVGKPDKAALGDHVVLYYAFWVLQPVYYSDLEPGRRWVAVIRGLYNYAQIALPFSYHLSSPTVKRSQVVECMVNAVKLCGDSMASLQPRVVGQSGKVSFDYLVVVLAEAKGLECGPASLARTRHFQDDTPRVDRWVREFVTTGGGVTNEIRSNMEVVLSNVLQCRWGRGEGDPWVTAFGGAFTMVGGGGGELPCVPLPGKGDASRLIRVNLVVHPLRVII